MDFSLWTIHTGEVGFQGDKSLAVASYLIDEVPFGQKIACRVGEIRLSRPNIVNFVYILHPYDHCNENKSTYYQCYSKRECSYPRLTLQFAKTRRFFDGITVLLLGGLALPASDRLCRI